ncbi:hypothetical protein ANN_16061 [Periplaneta americana]|uniref:Uncharacterized protein n=1 Tax=Periplaneta americana TaxID=6978 RepID=A0ABQ8SHX5_PERAM|nr:hypothetical protein ANN_16061 [Periplaneta americana]
MDKFISGIVPGPSQWFFHFGEKIVIAWIISGEYGGCSSSPRFPSALEISSVACLACLCSSGTVKVGLFMLPLIGRLRLMMFVTVFSLLVTCLFIFLDISHIVYFFPFNWGKVIVTGDETWVRPDFAPNDYHLFMHMKTWLGSKRFDDDEELKTSINALFYVSVSVLYLIGSSLVIHLIHMYHESYSWVPKWTRDQLLVTGILGYLCALEALLLSIITRRSALQYSPVDEDPSQMTLQERRDRELQPMTGSRSPSSTSLQLQVPPSNQLPTSQQKQQQQQQWTAIPSTSAPPGRVWPVDDVQPCSSKYPDPYTVA